MEPLGREAKRIDAPAKPARAASRLDRPGLKLASRDQESRAALVQHWAASDANDFDTEQRIYHENAVLEYPQSGERRRGRHNILNQRASEPRTKRFTVRRIVGRGDLWVTEFILTYDGKPSYTVRIMEFRSDKVTREARSFSDPFVAPAWPSSMGRGGGHIGL